MPVNCVFKAVVELLLYAACFPLYCIVMILLTVVALVEVDSVLVSCLLFSALIP